jgi:FkbM family methyltransferase
MLRVPGYAWRLAAAGRNLRGGRPCDYERREFQFVSARLRELRRFVDVGAYLGDYAIPIAIAAPQSEVVALEPMPSTFAALRALTRLFRLKNVELRNVAGGATDGVAEIAVELVAGAPSPMSASLEQSATAGTAQRKFAVRVTTVDAVLGGRPADLVKIDVEGHEEETLRGMSATLDSKPTVICELWRSPAPALERRTRVFDWMGQRGYTTHVLDAGGRPVPVTKAVLEESDRENWLYTNYVFLPTP